jgi:hypothetical protein
MASWLLRFGESLVLVLIRLEPFFTRLNRDGRRKPALKHAGVQVASVGLDFWGDTKGYSWIREVDTRPYTPPLTRDEHTGQIASWGRRKIYKRRD